MGVSTEGYGLHEEGPVAVPLRIDRRRADSKTFFEPRLGSGWMTGNSDRQLGRYHSLTDEWATIRQQPAIQVLNAENWAGIEGWVSGS